MSGGKINKDEQEYYEANSLPAFITELAFINSKRRLLQALQYFLRQIDVYSDLNISVFDKDAVTFSAFLLDDSKPRANFPDYKRIANSHYAYPDSFFEVIFKKKTLSFFHLSEIVNENSPSYLKLLYESGVKEIVGVPLYREARSIGGLFLFSGELKIFSESQQELVKSMAAKLSIAVANIIDREEIINKKRQMETLLAMSTKITEVKDKMELLPLLRENFKKNGLYTDIAISLINDDRQTTSGYLIDWKKRRHQHPGYAYESTAKHQIADGIFDVVLRSKHPVSFDLQEVVRREYVPSYIQFLYARGIRHIIAVALRDKALEIGIIYLFSHDQRIFKDSQLSLLYGMCQQIGTAVANIRAVEAKQREEYEKSILFDLSHDVAQIRNKKDLLDVINSKPKELLPFNHGGVGIIDKDNKRYKAFLFDPNLDSFNESALKSNFYEGYSIEDDIVEAALNASQPVVFDLDKIVKTRSSPLYTSINHAGGMKELVIAPLCNEEGSFGFFAILSDRNGQFTKNHLNIMQAIANLLAIAVNNIYINEEILERESENAMLLSLSKDITSCKAMNDIQNIVNKKLAKYFQFNELMICLNNEDNLTHNCYVSSVTEVTKKHPDFARGSEMKYFINDGVWNVIMDAEEPVVFDMNELMCRNNRPFYVDFWNQLSVKEIIGFPIRMNNKSIGGTTLYPKKKDSFTSKQLRLAQAICSYLGIALSNIKSYEKMQSQVQEIDGHNLRLEQENLYLQEMVDSNYNYREIIGSSNGMRNVFKLISNVAASDSTVLLQGETGTGKELIARAIHDSSPRRGKLMIKINCAALPPTLIESELFGHERGSFTGASERRIGKFELANASTLFLDEIGEMPLELQVKLLRAIQEKEIERIGGKGIVNTDVRIIAATNRDLQKEVEAGRFRNDLYYRLHVFPITLPPLRERMEDIPMLVAHFISKFGYKSGKKITNVSPKAIKSLMLYDWPGNVRELEHVMERSIIMASGPIIEDVQLPRHQEKMAQYLPDNGKIKSLEENERDYIVEVLKECNWKISGSGQAAEILGLPTTTLHSKIKKLGIKKPHL